MRFVGVKGFRLASLTVKDPESYAALICAAENFTVENIVFDYNLLRTNMDGIHVQGEAKNGVIRDIKATTNDDPSKWLFDKAKFKKAQIEKGWYAMASEFVYFHAYTAELWNGYVKRGFIRSNAGVRFCESLLLDESIKFNRLAQKGSALWNLIAENKYPLYIDRLQGGCYIEDYPYDMQLVNDYKELLKDSFFGFQMHEWMSNMRSDFNKLKGLSSAEWTEENIIAEIRRQFHFPQLFLEAANAKEFACELLPPKSYEDFLSLSERLYKKRQTYTESCLLPCDSVIMAAKLELENGTKRLMPEIGAQTPASNVQIAYARGMSKAYDGSFGAYYEPWGGKPFSACCYHESSKNEWNIVESDFPFKTEGGEGGSSRSLQMRLHLYAYLAGASFISEEWGGYNSFYDFNDYEVTPYGKIKLDFLDFADKYKPGKFYAPMAIVLPADMLVLENVYGTAERWFGSLPFKDNLLETKFRAAGEGIRSLMCDSLSKFGNEKASLINSDIPDAFDIVHEDSEKALDNYAYLVDLTGNEAFKAKHKNAVSVKEAKEAVNSLMPCEVSGGLHWFVNRLPDGWYLTIMNNDGVDKSVDGEKIMPQAVKTAVIDIKSNTSLTRLEGSEALTKTDGKYCVTLNGGEWFFAKIAR